MYLRLVHGEQALPPDSYSLSPKTTEAHEDVGSITFNVNRTDTSKDETLYVSTMQTQGFVNESDYVGLLNEPLSFLETESSRPVQIQILDDAIAESNETFGLIVQASPTDPLETFLASATFTVLDNDTVAPAPVISATPNDLDFDSVAIGQSSAIQDFTVRNTGSGVLSGTCATSPPFYFAYPPCAYDLGANEFADVALYFRPESEGPSVGTVSFSSNAGNLSRTVTGTGTTPTTPQPAISVTPESLDFGSVIIGQTSPTQPVTVTNAGTANLTLGTLTVTGTNPGDYQLASNTCNGQNIAPQAACSFAVAFKPAAVGRRSASVSIPSNDPVNPTKAVSVAGEGVADTLQLDIDAPPLLPRLDFFRVGKANPQLETELLAVTGSERDNLGLSNALPGDECYLGAMDAIVTLTARRFKTIALQKLAWDIFTTSIGVVSTGSPIGDYLLKFGAQIIGDTIIGVPLEESALVFFTENAIGYIARQSTESLLLGEAAESLTRKSVEELLKKDDPISWTLTGSNQGSPFERDDLVPTTNIVSEIFYSPYTHYTTAVIGATCSLATGTVTKQYVLRYQVTKVYWNDAEMVGGTLKAFVNPL